MHKRSSCTHELRRVVLGRGHDDGAGVLLGCAERAVRLRAQRLRLQLPQLHPAVRHVDAAFHAALLEPTSCHASYFTFTSFSLCRSAGTEVPDSIPGRDNVYKRTSVYRLGPGTVIIPITIKPVL